jgi:hypothetical protein
MPTPNRLPYTGRDIFVIDADVDRYIQYYLPEITDTSKATGGRIYLQGHEGLVDMINFQCDRLFAEGLWSKFNELRSGLYMAEALAYSYIDASPDSVDLVFTTIGETPAVSPISILKDEIIKTTTSPVRDFVIVETKTIQIGQTTVTATAMEGTQVNGETLTSSASGDVHQKYRIAGKRVYRERVEVEVAAETWDRVDQFYDDPVTADVDSGKVYRVTFDDEHNAYVVFGDDKWGRAPGAGALITVNYWKCNGSVGAPPGTVQKIANGALAAQVSCTNPGPSSGGTDGKTADDIRFEAPAVYRTRWRAVNAQDYIDLAKSRAGVYEAAASQITGSFIELYIIPYGGGQASAAILSDVKAFLEERALLGAAIDTKATEDAYIAIEMDVHLRDASYDKGVVHQLIYDAIVAQLHWQVLRLGVGFRKSDVYSLIESLEDGRLVDYLNITRLTRIPRVRETNPAGVHMQGDVEVKEDATAGEWVLTALEPTGSPLRYYFSVSKGGQAQPNGEIGYLYSNDEIAFTLGTIGDVPTADDAWAFEVSPYNDNIQIDGGEVMALRYPSDIGTTIYYPGES